MSFYAGDIMTNQLVTNDESSSNIILPAVDIAQH